MTAPSTPHPTPDSEPLVVLHAAPLHWKYPSGVSACLPELLAAQNSRPDIRAALVLTSNADGIPSDCSFPVFHWRSLRQPTPFALPSPFDRPHLVVFHSTYIPVHAALARRIRQVGIPYLVCPHGGLTRYSQAHRKWKKRLGNLLFFNRLMAGAVAVQCLTEGEAAASGDWHRPVFVVGNGVHPPAEADLARPGQRNGLRLVFLGRLDTKIKGLDMLLDACALVHDELRRRGAQIELHGPDQKGSAQDLAQRITQLGLADVVALKDPVHGQDKAALLQQTDILLLTSRTEGHPMAVLEALSYGVPCMLTPGTNMAEEVAAANAGWQVAPSPHAIADGLQKILAADQRTLEVFGANARQLAIQMHTWEQVAHRTVQAYRKYAA